jgi:hypothetical protein
MDIIKGTAEVVGIDPVFRVGNALIVCTASTREAVVNVFQGTRLGHTFVAIVSTSNLAAAITIIRSITYFLSSELLQFIPIFDITYGTQDDGARDLPEEDLPEGGIDDKSLFLQ